MKSKQPEIYACVIVTLTVATLSFVLRLFSRKIRGIPLWLDDYFAVLAFLAALAYNASKLYYVHIGLGLHIQDALQSVEKTRFDARVETMIGNYTYFITISMCQLSLLFLYWRMFSITNIRVPIILLMACSIAWCIATVVLATFQCVPVQGYWDKTIDAKCDVNTSAFFMGAALSHLLLDLGMIGAPISQIRQLRLPFWQKVGTMLLFMFGVVVCVASIMTIVESARFDYTSGDVTWNIVPVALWTEVEINLSVISTNLPMIRPIIGVLTPYFQYSPFQPITAQTHALPSTLSYRLGRIITPRQGPGVGLRRQLAAAASERSRSTFKEDSTGLMSAESSSTAPKVGDIEQGDMGPNKHGN
ncbi:hypothetical protein F5B20DRAFT_191992 [Whalleya microplaca]|nr:hypothetical protein F5B20DRAFT_191992 [Whalleya microplaca]